MFWIFGHKAYGILAPWLGIEPIPPALEGKVLTTGSSGRFLKLFIYTVRMTKSALWWLWKGIETQ